MANPSASKADLAEAERALIDSARSQPPPSIAVVGDSGVGKSKTLNALFNAGVEVSHTRACTREGIALNIDFTREGDEWERLLTVYDMPGLNESQEEDIKNLAVYHEVLPRVDAIVWVLDAQYRAIRGAQERLEQDISKIDGALGKMVIALNKVDLVDPGEEGWNTVFNLPSEQQRLNIEGRQGDIAAKLRKYVPGWSGATVVYSAARRYRLADLFEAMLMTISEERRWLLGDLMDLASFEELVDSQVLQAVRDDRPA